MNKRSFAHWNCSKKGGDKERKERMKRLMWNVHSPPNEKMK